VGRVAGSSHARRRQQTRPAQQGNRIHRESWLCVRPHTMNPGILAAPPHRTGAGDRILTRRESCMAHCNRA
jgi:hypothetical protein